MRKFIPILLIILAAGSMFANAYDFNQPPNLNSAFALGARNDSNMRVNFVLPEYSVQEETYGETVYHKIMLPLSGTLMETGMPELPTVCTYIAIPHRGGVNIEVLSTQQTVIPNFLPYPVQQGNNLESPKGFVLNSDYYNGVEVTIPKA